MGFGSRVANAQAKKEGVTVLTPATPDLQPLEAISCVIADAIGGYIQHPPIGISYRLLKVDWQAELLDTEKN